MLNNKEREPKISVVVPVYNAEKYIDRCIQSITGQIYNNWELILVNDGSTDDSLNILNKWCRTDSRIVVINQENSGPGIARNNGVKNASGEFVVFVDSDDYLDLRYFSLLRNHMNNSDVVFIDVLQVDSNGILLRKEKMSSYKKWDNERILRAQMTGKIPWGGVRKVARRQMLIDKNIQYTNHKIGEEALYSMKLLLAATNISFLDECPVYYYVNHVGSQSKIKMDDPWGGVVDVVRNYLISQSLIGKYGNTVNAFSITATIISLDCIVKNHKDKNEIKQLVNNRVNYYRNTAIRNSSIDFKNLDCKALLMYPFLKINFLYPIILISKLRGGI